MIKIWESSRIIGIFIFLLIFDLFGTSYLSSYLIKKLIILKRDKKTYEKLIQELNDLLIHSIELNLSLEEIKLDLINLFEEYGEKLQDENIRELCLRLVKEKNE